METATLSYKKWHLPFSNENVLLADAMQSLTKVKTTDMPIPLLIRLVENPHYKLPWITLFHGAVTMSQHDCIHFLLGRGLLPKDEAFVIGMTMGSTGKMYPGEATVYCFISRFLYPRFYRLNKQDCDVFMQGIGVAQQMKCKPLDTFPFNQYLNEPLVKIRERAGIDCAGLVKAYAEEKKRYPNDPASARLLS